MASHSLFSYQPRDRERLLRFLHQGGLEAGADVTIWSSSFTVQSRTELTVLETDDSRRFYELGSVWSEYGQLSATAEVPLAEA
ncbi:MAG: hypothetical protein U0992_20610 [Planctomycetaceae bacterium]